MSSYIQNEKNFDIYAKEYKIFLDTCSILHPSVDKFWINIIPFLQKYQNKIIIPYRVIEELKKHSENKKKLELAINSKKSLKIIDQLINAKYVEIRGEKSDGFADNVFQSVFTKFRICNKLLLITQDNNLRKDILKLNKMKSVRGYNVHVKKINNNGLFEDVNNLKNKSINLKEDETFKIYKDVTSIQNITSNILLIPSKNEKVYTSNAVIRLIDEVASGGEGVIYTTDTPYVAKIYKKENNTIIKFKKIELMLTKKIKYEGICYPIDILYNKNREFIGYLMPKASGKELQKSIFIKKLFQKNFPTWKKRDTVELCVTILKKIEYLHDRNIIMGDINPANILVVSPKEVYFVDTDSYQVERFPCPVGTNNYTAPEIQRKHFSTFLRTIGNENFAVATLLFMIMLPGKPPYSQQGGEDPIANIINMDFSYPFKDNSNKKTPEGAWRYIWSHLTYDLKKAFYNTFRKEGDYATENTRLSVKEWLSKFELYLKLLDTGKFGEQDKMSEEIYPIRHKKNPKFSYITCKICNNEFPEQQCKNKICKACLNKGEVYSCKECGKELLYTNYQKYIKGSKRFEICSECYEIATEVKMRSYCNSCGNIFEITNKEYKFFQNKGLSIPKRCKDCRESKKNTSSNETHNSILSDFLSFFKF